MNSAINPSPSGSPLRIYNPLALRPNLFVVVNNERPYISWTRANFSAIELFVNRNDGNDWISLGRFSLPNICDRAPLPEHNTEWNYRAYYLVGDNRVGEISSVASILVKKG